MSLISDPLFLDLTDPPPDPPPFDFFLRAGFGAPLGSCEDDSDPVLEFDCRAGDSMPVFLVRLGFEPLVGSRAGDPIEPFEELGVCFLGCFTLPERRSGELGGIFDDF